jgi:hypothetical protein
MIRTRKFFQAIVDLLKTVAAAEGADLIRQKSPGPILRYEKHDSVTTKAGRCQAMRVPKGAFTQTTLKIVEAEENRGSLNVCFDDIADYFFGETNFVLSV